MRCLVGSVEGLVVGTSVCFPLSEKPVFEPVALAQALEDVVNAVEDALDSEQFAGAMAAIEEYLKAIVSMSAAELAGAKVLTDAEKLLDALSSDIAAAGKPKSNTMLLEEKVAAAKELINAAKVFDPADEVVLVQATVVVQGRRADVNKFVGQHMLRASQDAHQLVLDAYSLAGCEVETLADGTRLVRRDGQIIDEIPPLGDALEEVIRLFPEAKPGVPKLT